MAVSISGSGAITGMVSADSSDLSTALAAKAALAGATYTGTHDFSAATLVGVTAAIASAEVSTSQTTTSSAWTDLATTGPSVTLTTGTKALVVVSATMWNSSASYRNYMGVVVSGASTVAEDYGKSLVCSDAIFGASRVFLLDGLTAGSNTFTNRYRVNGGTGTFQDRHIFVMDMGS